MSGIADADYTYNLFGQNIDDGKREFQQILENKRNYYGIIDVEDNYSEEQILNILKGDANIKNLADLRNLPSKAVRDYIIFRMNKELHLTPKAIENFTNLSVDYIRRIIKKYEKSLNIGKPVPFKD